MMDGLLTGVEITRVLNILIGNTTAVGETNADEKAIERLKVLEVVTDWCMDGFYYNTAYAHRNEWSMRQIGKESIRWLKETYDWIGEILVEDERRS